KLRRFLFLEFLYSWFPNPASSPPCLRDSVVNRSGVTYIPFYGLDSRASCYLPASDSASGVPSCGRLVRRREVSVSAEFFCITAGPASVSITTSSNTTPLALVQVNPLAA